jgi:hypothetical protein
MWIAKSADSPPLFYISTHGGFSSQPSVVLHSGSTPNFIPIANAQFHNFSSTINITIGRDNYSLLKNGTLSSVEFFDFFVNATAKMERFEWKSSSGPEVAALRGKSHGMKLVRVGTGEVVAAWARPNSGTRKKGKLRFTARDRGELDDKWELMAVVSISAIIEKSRRSRNNRVIAGGAAGGGGGGGGGC